MDVRRAGWLAGWIISTHLKLCFHEELGTFMNTSKIFFVCGYCLCTMFRCGNVYEKWRKELNMYLSVLDPSWISNPIRDFNAFTYPVCPFKTLWKLYQKIKKYRPRTSTVPSDYELRCSLPFSGVPGVGWGAQALSILIFQKLTKLRSSETRLLAWD